MGFLDYAEAGYSSKVSCDHVLEEIYINEYS